MPRIGKRDMMRLLNVLLSTYLYGNANHRYRGWHRRQELSFDHDSCIARALLDDW
jgi:hypothetical protein